MHDLAADVNLGSLTTGERRTVIKDAADVVRGLVVLDRRYELIPGLNAAARACTTESVR